MIVEGGREGREFESGKIVDLKEQICGKMEGKSR